MIADLLALTPLNAGAMLDRGKDGRMITMTFRGVLACQQHDNPTIDWVLEHHADENKGASDA